MQSRAEAAGAWGRGEGVGGGSQCLLNSANSKAKKIKPLQARRSFVDSGLLTKIKCYRVSQAVTLAETHTGSCVRGWGWGLAAPSLVWTRRRHSFTTQQRTRTHVGTLGAAWGLVGGTGGGDVGTSPAAGDPQGKEVVKGLRPLCSPTPSPVHANHFKALLDRSPKNGTRRGAGFRPL